MSDEAHGTVQSTRLTSAVDLDDHTQGLECFYNIALTPAAQLTLDAQWIDSRSWTLLQSSECG